MEIGAVFPQTEIGADVGAVRAWAQGVEALGFDHVLAYDHVLGADPAHRPGWTGPYDVHSTFHEPLVLFGFLAGCTRLALATAVVVLPQRQTALAAKQAAEVDILTGGRLRFGVGIGWNRVEYEALGQDFTTRGRRLEEQVDLLRRLWTQDSLVYDGDFDRIPGAGIAPRPVQRPIPVWFGGSSAPAYRRMGRLADGWFPQLSPGPSLDAARVVVDRAAAEAGRDPARIGMEGRVRWRGDPDRLAHQVIRWQESGATHVSVATNGQGLAAADDHLVSRERNTVTSR